MSYRKMFGRSVLGVGTLFAMMSLSIGAFAAAPDGCYYGVWMINEELTKRTRPPRSPMMVFFAPWGDNGWVRMSGINGEEREGRQSGELRFLTWGR